MGQIGYDCESACPGLWPTPPKRVLKSWQAEGPARRPALVAPREPQGLAALGEFQYHLVMRAGLNSRTPASCAAGFALLVSGQAQHPPIYTPTADADPSIRHDVVVAVPTRLSVERTPDRLVVGFDLTSTEGVKTTLGDRMTMGVKWELRVWGEGEARPVEANGGVGLGGPVNSSDLGLNGKDFLSRSQGGIPESGKSYIVEEDVSIFETDIPAQHMWSPTSKKYSVLWENKIQYVSSGEQ